jgi:tetratricopeptide (TPR) repeat protein
VAGLAAARQGRWTEAQDALQEGLTLARRIGYPYGEARLLQGLGELYTHLGQPEAARERLAAALSRLQRLGARQDAARVAQALAATLQSQGVPPSPNGAGRPVETRVSAAQWAAIAPLLPQEAATGRPRAGDRQTLTAILYKLETGCAWQAIPTEYGAGVTAYRRLRAWQAAGVWDRILSIVQDGPP